MRRLSLSLWPAMYLLFPLLSSGCQCHRPSCTNGSVPSDVAMEAPLSVTSKELPAVASETTAAAGKGSSIVTTSAKPSSTFAADAPPPLVAPSLSSPRNLPLGPQGVATVATGPRFAHDPHYRRLVGTLDYSRIQRGWLLRYASYEEDDRYGGVVTLLMSDRETHFKSGQTVRVEGALVDPESRQLRPAYRVQNVRFEQP